MKAAIKTKLIQKIENLVEKLEKNNLFVETQISIPKKIIELAKKYRKGLNEN